MFDETTSLVLCPRCQHDVGCLTFTCHTILAVTCARCGHAWAAAAGLKLRARADMPEPIRVAVQAEMLNRDHPGYTRH